METGPLDPRIKDAIREAIAQALPSAKVGSDIGHVLTQMYPPLASVPELTRYIMARDMVMSFAIPANQPAGKPLVISEPMICYALSAAVIRTDTGADVSLNTVEYQAKTNTERYNSDPTLMGAIFGTAAQPRIIGGRGWEFDPQMNIQLTLQNLSGNPIRVDLVWQSLLLRIGGN